MDFKYLPSLGFLDRTTRKIPLKFPFIDPLIPSPLFLVTTSLPLKAISSTWFYFLLPFLSALVPPFPAISSSLQQNTLCLLFFFWSLFSFSNSPPFIFCIHLILAQIYSVSQCPLLSHLLFLSSLLLVWISFKFSLK